MRYRQSNKSDGNGTKHVKSLIDSDDVLSTQEQEEVIRYFADSMKSSRRFLLVVGGLHLLIAIVYLTLLLSGSPLISTFSDGSQKQVFRDMVAYATSVGQAQKSVGENSHHRPDADALHQLERNRRAADEKAVLDYMAKRAGGGGADGLRMKDTSGSFPSLMSNSSICVMLLSAALLACGGYGCWMAYKSMRLDTNDLLKGTVKDSDGQPERFQKSADGCGEAAASGADGSDGKKGECCTREWQKEHKNFSATLPSTAQPRFQYVLALAALLPTAYWAASSAMTTREVNALYEAVGPSVAANMGLPSVRLSDRIPEMMLMAWQPVFHTCIGQVLRSLYEGRSQLVALSRLKYGYEKV